MFHSLFLFLIFSSFATHGWGIEKSPVLEKTGTLNLSQCYLLALKNNETILIQTQKIIQTDENYKQTLSSVFPHLNFIFTQFYQDTSGVETGSSGVGGTFTRKDRPEAKVTLRQPIFAGLKEFYGMSALKHESKKETFLLQHLAKLLFREVAISFYKILELEKELKNVQTALNLTQNRIKELSERVRLGKSRPSELLSLESEEATLQSSVEQLKGEISTAKEEFSFLLGLPLEPAGLVDELKLEEVKPLAELLKKVSSKTEIKALEEELKSKKSQMKLAQGNFYPTLNLLGNYYTKRVGFQEQIDWDLLFTLDFPIFQGGTNLASLRLAVSQAQQIELELKKLYRKNESEIKKATIVFHTSLAQSSVLEQALKKANESYELHVKEYRLGLVNNLEVLQAIHALQDAQHRLDKTIIQTKLNYLQLKITLEELP
ncbi:MAG: TolC family protein [Elusimicrobia bacterium]|nr:TolC family protein [Elusimicrobiota bacterium]